MRISAFVVFTVVSMAKGSRMQASGTLPHSHYAIAQLMGSSGQGERLPGRESRSMVSVFLSLFWKPSKMGVGLQGRSTDTRQDTTKFVGQTAGLLGIFSEAPIMLQTTKDLGWKWYCFTHPYMLGLKASVCLLHQAWQPTTQQYYNPS